MQDSWHICLCIGPAEWVIKWLLFCYILKGWSDFKSFLLDIKREGSYLDLLLLSVNCNRNDGMGGNEHNRRGKALAGRDFVQKKAFWRKSGSGSLGKNKNKNKT